MQGWQVDTERRLGELANAENMIEWEPAVETKEIEQGSRIEAQDQVGRSVSAEKDKWKGWWPEAQWEDKGVTNKD